MDHLQMALNILENAYALRRMVAVSEARKLLVLIGEKPCSSFQGIAFSILDALASPDADGLNDSRAKKLTGSGRDAYLRAYMSLCWLDAARLSDQVGNERFRKLGILKCTQLYHQILRTHANMSPNSAMCHIRYVEYCIASALESLRHWETALFNSDCGESFSIGMVLGMHRSGTSCFSNFLGNLGYTHPGNLLPPNDKNPLGYFEAEEIYNDNNSLLNILAPMRGWKASLRLIADDAKCRQALENWKRDVAGFLASHARKSPLVIKDPRFCILLDFIAEWTQHGACLWHFFFLVRDPFSSAKSLSLTGKTEFDEALRIWISYNLQAEASTRSLKRIFILYPEIVNDPPEWFEKVKFFAKDFLPLGFPLILSDQAVCELDQSLIHSNPGHSQDIQETFDDLDSTVASLATDLYKLLRETAISQVPIPQEAVAKISERFELLSNPQNGFTVLD